MQIIKDHDRLYTLHKKKGPDENSKRKDEMQKANMMQMLIWPHEIKIERLTWPQNAKTPIFLLERHIEYILLLHEVQNSLQRCQKILDYDIGPTKVSI